jgi:hypothetical protein
VRGVIVALAVFALAVIPGASTARADVIPSYLIQDTTVPEADSVAQIPVLLLGPAPSTGVELSYTEVDGTATSSFGGLFPPDYIQQSGFVFIPPGATSGFIPVQILSDGIDEPDETFTVQALPVFGAVPIDPIATVTIVDADLPPLLQWDADVSTLEGNSGSHSVSLTAKLNRISEKTIVATVQTADGTATGGTASPADYATATRQLVFQPGDTSETVSFDVFGDTNIEPTETFQARIVSAQNAQLAGGKRFATITIVNDDDVTPPVIASRPGLFVQTVLSSVAVPYTPPTAVDAVDGPVPVSCSPASGSFFPAGGTVVTCSAQDRSGNVATSTFAVNVFHPLTIGAVTNPGDLGRPLSAVAPGQRVRVTAGGFAPRLEVTLTLLTESGAALPEGSAVAGTDGRIDARPKIPDDASDGSAQMMAVGVAPDGTELVRAWHLIVGTD